MAKTKQLNGGLKTIDKDFIARNVNFHLSFLKRKNQLLDKSVGLKNGLSAEEHCGIYQMKAANQLIRSEDYSNII